jgi:hypothetical protein
VSRAADSEAELTVALDGMRTRRWPQNRQRSTVGGGGAPCTRGQRESGREDLAEGANERGEMGEQGARLKRGAGARMWRRTCNTPGVYIPLDNEYGFKHVISVDKTDTKI